MNLHSNLRRTRQPSQPRGVNVDGFITPDSFKGEGSLTPRVRQHKELPEPNRVDNFQRPDGYHPAAPALAGTDAALTTTVLPNGPRQRYAHESGAQAPPIGRTKKKKRLSRRSKILRGVIGFLLLVVLTGAFLFAKGYISLHRVFKGGSAGAPALQKDVDPTKLKGEGDGRINILLLGKGGDGHEAPDLTDTILVASIDPVNNKAAILSVPRDLLVKNSSGGSVKINEIYADAKYRVIGGKRISNQAQAAEDAGLSAIDTTVSQTMGIPIHYHVVVDFKAFQEAVDTVGGIDVNVTTALRDTLWLEDTGKNFTINVQPGMHHFDGRTALVYARSRYTSVRGDFDRSERQRGVILALKQKVFSLGTFSNPIKISQLFNTFGNHVGANMTVNEIMRLYTISKMINNSQVTSVGLADPPNNYITTANIGGKSVVVPRAGTYNYAEIQSYIRNTLRDGYIAKENANITVLNGSAVPGLATKQANVLKSYGYKVGQVGDAPTHSYQKTMLIDLRSGTKKYTRHYLEQRLGVTATSKIPDSAINPGSADFVIILGANATSL